MTDTSPRKRYPYIFVCVVGIMLVPLFAWDFGETTTITTTSTISSTSNTTVEETIIERDRGKTYLEIIGSNLFTVLIAPSVLLLLPQTVYHIRKKYY